ncbi:MAG: hypothetical protein ACK5M7_17565, partial [Draconibacterium sp.]
TPKPKSLLNRSKFSEHFKETLKENHSVYKNKTGLAEWLPLTKTNAMEAAMTIFLISYCTNAGL